MPATLDELAAIKAIVDSYNKSSAAKAQIKVQAFPQDVLQRLGVSAAAAEEAAVHLGHRRAQRAELGVGQLPDPLKPSADLSKNHPQHRGQVAATRLYSVGYYDVALAMLARDSDLKAAGVRAATIDKPWTKDEFQDALTKLKALGKWQYPLDMGTAGTGEWLPYAYSPLLPVLRRRPDQPRRLPDSGRCAQRRQGRRVGRLVPRTRR